MPAFWRQTMHQSTRRRELAALTALLLAITASRAIHFDRIQMHWDEVWAIWQTFGTPGQILEWTPYDWSPLYFLSLGAWKAIVGIHPAALRILSLFSFLLSAACIYRLARRLWNAHAGVLVTLVYSALTYSVYFSIIVRGYAFLLALVPPTLWFTVRYFDRPTWWRAVPLALSMAALFYVQPTSIIAFAMLGIYTLTVYRSGVYRWWRPGVLAALLALPEIINKARLAGNHLVAIQNQSLPPFWQTIQRLFMTYTGEAHLIWLALLIVATVLLLYYHRLEARVVALLVWVLAPALLYFLQPYIGIFRYGAPRYMWWVIPGAALWTGWGLSLLPRRAGTGALVVLVGLMFVPIPYNKQRDTSFETLAQHWRTGDVIVLDPNCQTCPAPEEWEYFGRVYFPNGIAFVDDPADHRRVWYAHHVTQEHPATRQAVNAGRVPGVFVGPPEFLLQLYEGPPDREGVRFENGLRFHGLEVIGAVPGRPVMHEGQAVTVRLWWSVDEAIPYDYSIGLFVMNQSATRLFAQADGPPQTALGTRQKVQTSAMEPDRFYIDERELALPNPMGAGTYRFFLTVYQPWDTVRIAAPGVNDSILLPLQNLWVKSW